MPSPPITASRIVRAAMRVPYWSTPGWCQDPRQQREGSAVHQVHHPGHFSAGCLGDLSERGRRHRRVYRQEDQRAAAPGVPADLHPGDIDLMAAENLADDADHAGPVGVAEE